MLTKVTFEDSCQKLEAWYEQLVEIVWEEWIFVGLQAYLELSIERHPSCMCLSALCVFASWPLCSIVLGASHMQLQRQKIQLIIFMLPSFTFFCMLHKCSIRDIWIGFMKSMFHNKNKSRMCLWSINLRETAFQ